MADGWDGTERRGGPDLASLQETIAGLIASNAELTETIHERNALVAAQAADLADIKERLPHLITKDDAAIKERRIATAIAILCAVLLFAVGAAGVLRVQDNHRESDRLDAIAAEKVQDRANSLAGCQRNNEFRATMREVISDAYAPSPIPPSLPPEFLDLYIQGQERQAAKRAEQLSKPGVQPVDCEAIYPPVVAER